MASSSAMATRSFVFVNYLNFNLAYLRNLGVFILFILLANVSASEVVPELTQDTLPSVTIKGQGVVLGNFDTTAWSQQQFMQFRGVPYAESPKGPLRFKAPVARKSWQNYVDATNWGRRCPVITSIMGLNATESAADLEDCLNLCVYTKNLTSKTPVMMYIHGGGFYNGTSLDHPPKYLMEEDIVLVVPQYRIGALGFVSSASVEIPGNAAIADMLFALQWIQNHIAQFGGDAERVTIFGQSAGAAMVGALMLSPKTPDNYFQRAIMQSGSIVAPWATLERPERQAQRICGNLKCANCENVQATNECLMSASVLSLLNATSQESISPVIGDRLGLLPENTAALFEKYNKSIAVMAGFTKHDGSYVLSEYYNKLVSRAGKAASTISVRNFIAESLDMMKDRTRLTNNLATRLFFKRELLDGFDHGKALANYFDSPVLALTSQLLARHDPEAVYLYSFDYVGKNTRFGYEMGNAHFPFNGGVHHSDDNIYLFSTHALNDEDAKIAQKMVQLWTSFASSGVPSAADNVTIAPMASESGPFFHINKATQVDYDAYDEFTVTMDDPFNYNLKRSQVAFL